MGWLAYLWSNQVVLHGEERGGRPGRDAQLAKDMLDVVVRGALRDAQLLRYLAVNKAVRNEAQDVDFPFGESCRVGPPYRSCGVPRCAEDRGHGVGIQSTCAPFST